MRHIKIKSSIALIGISLMLTSFDGEKKKPKIYHKDWIDFNKNGVKDIYEDPTQPIEKRVEDLLSQMNMKEKTMQMVTLYGYGRVAEQEIPSDVWHDELWKDGLANIDEPSNGVVTQSKYDLPYTKHVWAMNEIQKFFVEETRLGIPVEFTNEGIRGLNHTQSTNFPAQIGLGSSWNKELVNEIGKIVGTEGKALGYHNIYAPILDVARDQRWGRTVETYGEDPYLVTRLGVEMSKGMQDGGVVNTMKHFAIYSVPNGGRDGKSRISPHATPREIHEIYMYPFKKVIEETNPLGVMSSYNDWNGDPVTGSDYFLTQVLRNQFGFKGYVVSDSDALIHLYSKHKVAETYKEAIRQSVMAGLNVRTTFNHPSNFITPLRELVEEGKVPVAVIDERVREVLFVKFKEGLFDNPIREEKEAEIVKNDDFKATSLEASRESIVLLQNKNNALPLDLSKLNNILVTGPMAEEFKHNISRYGSLGLDVVTGLEGVQDFVGDKADVQYTKGSFIYDEHWPESEILPFETSAEELALMNDAVEKANASDVILCFVGGDEKTVGESVSRSSLNLPGNQEELIKKLVATGKPIITVLINGAPLSVNYADEYTDAVVEAWFPGEFGGKAIAEVLFGAYNPNGKLAVTFPRTVGQIPLTNLGYPSAYAGQHRNGPNGAGNSRIVKPLYPFGHGLSYTEYKYDNLTFDKTTVDGEERLIVKCEITNIGKRDGKEVVQLYYNDLYSSKITYDQILRGFEKVALKAGETKEIQFILSHEDLSFMDSDGNEILEDGDFEFMIGASGADLRLNDQIKLFFKGDQLTIEEYPKEFERRDVKEAKRY